MHLPLVILHGWNVSLNYGASSCLPRQRMESGRCGHTHFGHTHYWYASCRKLLPRNMILELQNVPHACFTNKAKIKGSFKCPALSSPFPAFGCVMGKHLSVNVHTGQSAFARKQSYKSLTATLSMVANMP